MHFKNLAHMLAANAGRSPRKTFLIHEDRKLSYREVNQQANRIARGLYAMGMARGDRVGILLENSPEFIITFYAVMKAGGIAVPVNTFLKKKEVAYILNDAEATFLFTSNHFAPVTVNIRESVTTLKEVLVFDEADFEAVNITRFSRTLDDADVEPTLDPEDVGVLIYSSGTTGHPKGAMLTHRNLLTNAQSCTEAFKVKRSDRFLLFLPMFHAYAFTTCVLLPTFMGASIIILGSVMDLKKKSFKKVLVVRRPTFFLGVPQVYGALSRSAIPKWFVALLYPVRLHVSGGAPLANETLERFNKKFNASILEGYGLSEASPVVSVNRQHWQKPYSVGQALPGVDVKVVDEKEVEVPTGSVGEIIVKGPNVMKGYWRMPGLTSETIRNGWLFTGDLGTIDEDGFISIVDRKKDLIIVKGMNVYPREIEELIHQFEGVEAASVLGLPDEHSGEVPSAYIKPAEGHSIDTKALKAFLKENLANYKIPKHFTIRDDLPMTATGKILKRELRRQEMEKMRDETS